MKLLLLAIYLIFFHVVLSKTAIVTAINKILFISKNNNKSYIISKMLRINPLPVT